MVKATIQPTHIEIETKIEMWANVTNEGHCLFGRPFQDKYRDNWTICLGDHWGWCHNSEEVEAAYQKELHRLSLAGQFLIQEVGEFHVHSSSIVNITSMEELKTAIIEVVKGKHKSSDDDAGFIGRIDSALFSATNIYSLGQSASLGKIACGLVYCVTRLNC